MSGAVARHLELHEQLVFERARADLTPEQEAAFAEQFERCWNELTDDEHTALERRLASEALTDAPPAPTAMLRACAQRRER